MTVARSLIQRGTTNYVTDPRFQGGTTRWLEMRIDPVVQDTDVTRAGVPSGRFVVNSVAGEIRLYTSQLHYTTLAGGKPISVSCGVRAGTAGRRMRLGIAFYTGVGTSFLSAALGTYVDVVTDGWTNLSLSAIAPPTADSAQFRAYVDESVAATSDTYWVVQPQMEESPFVTAYTDGTMAGSAWAGTSHASPSIRSARYSSGLLVPGVPAIDPLTPH